MASVSPSLSIYGRYEAGNPSDGRAKVLVPNRKKMSLYGTRAKKDMSHMVSIVSKAQ